MNQSPPHTLRHGRRPLNRRPTAEAVPQLVASLSIRDWTLLMRTLRLSPRESEIVQCMLVDEKEAVIAAHLGISSHTVHTHLERLYHKLRVNSRVGVVVRVLQEFVRLAAAPPEPADGVRLRMSATQPTAE